jgi:hypothetical protein
MFKVFREIWIKVRVSSWTSVGIQILEIGLLKDLLVTGCGFDHLPHLHYHMKEFF